MKNSFTAIQNGMMSVLNIFVFVHSFILKLLVKPLESLNSLIISSTRAKPISTFCMCATIFLPERDLCEYIDDIYMYNVRSFGIHIVTPDPPQYVTCCT